MGFKVENLESFKTDFDVLSGVDPEWMCPKPPNLLAEHEVVLRLFSASRYGQHQLADPDGNFIDVSDR